jgi:hypothetical protein
MQSKEFPVECPCGMWIKTQRAETQHLKAKKKQLCPNCQNMITECNLERHKKECLFIEDFDELPPISASRTQDEDYVDQNENTQFMDVLETSIDEQMLVEDVKPHDDDFPSSSTNRFVNWGKRKKLTEADLKELIQILRSKNFRISDVVEDLCKTEGDITLKVLTHIH